MHRFTERTRAITVESTHSRDMRDASQRMITRLRMRALEAFQDGFLAAVKMVESGATLDRLYEAARVAPGEWEDTLPTEIPLRKNRDFVSDFTSEDTAVE